MTTNSISSIRNGLHQLKRSNLMKDSMMVGLFSGIVGAVAVELLNIFMGKNLYFGKIASSMNINRLRSNRSKNMFIGEIMHLTVGAGIGSIIVALLKKTGKNSIYIKGIFVSLSAWLGLNHLGNRMDIFRMKTSSTKDHYFALLQHLIYGITTSAVINYFANPVIFQQSSILKSKNLKIQRRLNYSKPLSPTESGDENLNPKVELVEVWNLN